MRYLLVAVTDMNVDLAAEEIDEMPWICGVKQVVLDGIDFDEAERVCH